MDTDLFNQCDTRKVLVGKLVRDKVDFIIFKQFTIGVIDQFNTNLSMRQKDLNLKFDL